MEEQPGGGLIGLHLPPRLKRALRLNRVRTGTAASSAWCRGGAVVEQRVAFRRARRPAAIHHATLAEDAAHDRSSRMNRYQVELVAHLEQIDDLRWMT